MYVILNAPPTIVMDTYTASINTERSATPRKSSRVSSVSQQVQAPLLENDEIANRASSLSTEYGGVASDSSEEVAADVTEQTTIIPRSRSPLCPSPVETIFLSVIIIAILLIFSVPLFLHYLSAGAVQSTIPNCTNVSPWVFLPANCTPTLYNSTGVCVNHLMDWQLCAVGTSTVHSLYINHTSNTAELEMTASEILNATNITLECRAVLVPFICQYLFPLCDDPLNTGHGNLLLPSQKACRNTSELCREEDDIGEIAYLLPDCDSLPSQEEFEGVCAEGFFSSNGSCHASCHDWKQFGTGYAVALKAVQIFSAIVGILSTTALFITSACRYKTILKYPAIYIVFMTIGFFVPSVIGIIGLFDPGKLYCSDPSVTLSLQVPTPFCVLSGAVFQYFVVSATLWWFFHICSVLYKLVCPVMSKRRRKIDFVIHIVLTIIGCLAPVPGVILSIIQKDYWYQIPYFPPGGLCLSRDSSYLFNSTFLVYVISSGLGISMLSIIVWILYKYQRILKAGIKWRFTIPEIKLIVVFSVYTSIGFLLLFFAGIVTDKSLHVREDINSTNQDYFACEANGFVPRKCSAKFQNIQKAHHALLYPFLFLILGTLPLVNLVYVINWKYIKSKLQQCGKRRTVEETPTTYKPVVV